MEVGLSSYMKYTTASLALARPTVCTIESGRLGTSSAGPEQNNLSHKRSWRPMQATTPCSDAAVLIRADLTSLDTQIYKSRIAKIVVMFTTTWATQSITDIANELHRSAQQMTSEQCWTSRPSSAIDVEKRVL
jgi:hypothetical protein